MNTTLVIYHKADFDGLCSGAIAKRALADTADYLPWDYSDPIPDLSRYQRVYLIDISLPPAVMAIHASRLIWIDHHKSAIDAMKGVEIDGYRIDGVAACRLAWQWFNHPEDKSSASKQQFLNRELDEPYAVQLLGEYDIWDKRNPDTDLFQVGLQSVSDIDWAQLFESKRLEPAPDGTKHAHNPSLYVQGIIEKGRTIFDYLAVTNAQVSQERGFDVQFEGLTFRALNTARSNSLVFAASIKEHHDGCLSYFWRGNVWCFSLYGVEHKKHLDLSLIAVKYGGGGHRQACGGTFKALPKELGGA